MRVSGPCGLHHLVMVCGDCSAEVTCENLPAAKQKPDDVCGLFIYTNE